MSTIKTDTVTNVAGTKSVPVATVVDGSAKAWVNFNGTGTVAIRAAFNVSSITDGGVGIYTVNLTNALADANYAVAGTCRRDSSALDGTLSTDTYTTASFRANTSNSGGAYEDANIVCCVAFR